MTQTGSPTAWIAAALALATEGASGVGVAAMPGTVVYVAGSAIVMAGGGCTYCRQLEDACAGGVPPASGRGGARQEAGDRGVCSTLNLSE